MIQSGVDGWFWLHSDKYLEGETTRNKLSSEQSSMGRTTTLENIVCVVCRSKNPLLHTFTDEHPIFYEVLKQARRLNDEW
jgi:hypothetical protein